MRPGGGRMWYKWEVMVKRVGVKMQGEVGNTKARRVLNASFRYLGVPWGE